MVLAPASEGQDLHQNHPRCQGVRVNMAGSCPRPKGNARILGCRWGGVCVLIQL